MAINPNHIPMERIDHVAMTVKDLRRSVKFYEDVVGATVWHRWTNVWMMRRGDIDLGLYICPEGKPVDDLARCIAFQHIAFLTTEVGLKEAQLMLEEQGIEYQGPHDTGIAWSLYFYDPDGHELEFTYYYNASTGTTDGPRPGFRQGQRTS